MGNLYRVSWKDIDGLRRFDNALKSLGSKKFRQVANRAINRTGSMAKTRVVRALTKQTGLKRKVIVRAIRVKRSNWTTLTYSMESTGGDIALKYFDARETRRGVTAKPFGKRQLFPGTFMKGGHFPKRVSINMAGHVWARTGSARLPIEKQTSGVAIPAEMIKDQTREAFDSTVKEVLPRRVEHELKRLTGGVLS